MRRRTVLTLFALLALSSSAPAAEQPAIDEHALKPAYDAFVKSLNHQTIAQRYPEAVRKLDSADPKEVIVGLKVLAATGEPAAIPWIVPHLDSNNPEVRTWAGCYLENVVSGHELKRRDARRPDRMVIKPPGPGDLDLKPVAWIILKMLHKPDDGNTHAYSATMIGYLGLREFEGELRTLSKSRHPAVTAAARYALQVLGLEPPAFTAVELAAASATVGAFGKVFRDRDEDRLGLLLIPRDSLPKVLSDQALEGADLDSLYSKMVSANIRRFTEFRSMCGDLSKMSSLSFQPGQPVESKSHSSGVRVMKNAFVVLADGDRVEIKIKIEDMVFLDGKCFIVKID